MEIYNEFEDQTQEEENEEEDLNSSAFNTVTTSKSSQKGFGLPMFTPNTSKYPSTPGTAKI